MRRDRRKVCKRAVAGFSRRLGAAVPLMAATALFSANLKAEDEFSMSPETGVVFDIGTMSVFRMSKGIEALAQTVVSDGTGELAAETGFSPSDLEMLASVEATYAPYEERIEEGAEEFVPFSVFEPDDRVVVIDTTKRPHRSIVSIVFWNPARGRREGCTGGLVSANVVLTAGHCLYTRGFWHTEMEVIPGRNGGTQPFGSCKAVQYYAPEGWTNGASDTNFDFGAIRLDCSIGAQTGWFAVAPTPATAIGAATRISGYPCDKAPEGRQWLSVDQVVAETDGKVFYRNDTWGCMSGSPVFFGDDADTIFAIHTNGVSGSDPPWSDSNAATRLTQERITNLTAWMGQ